jgi:hypothetical protein
MGSLSPVWVRWPVLTNLANIGICRTVRDERLWLPSPSAGPSRRVQAGGSGGRLRTPDQQAAERTVAGAEPRLIVKDD